jgi:hypothetical protein
MPNPYALKVTAQDGITTLTGKATFTDPANQPGGSLAALLLAGEFTSQATGVPPLWLTEYVPYDPVTLAGGNFRRTLSAPAAVYGAGAVASCGTTQVTGVDTTQDAYDLTVQFWIVKADLSQVLVLSGLAVANAGGPGDSASIAPASLAEDLRIGADLVNTAGAITSVAGDTYALAMIISAGWD